MNRQIVLKERSDMTCDGCENDFTVLNYIGRKQLCLKCFLKEANRQW
jgi:hypothetical protein